ncbi:MAG: hypothetical protein JWO57_65 [Pseudonocardiales bacterium]|jgi:hypothetical protein|nr:hypothetical protein [Pseudonocardiales bacterium]
MAMFRRRDTPPADVVGRLPKGERVLSWADIATGGAVLATPLGLWWPDGDGPRLIAWQYIDKAVWRDGVLTVVEADVLDDLFLVDRPPLVAALSTPRDLPPTVRRRIEGNVVRSDLQPVDGGAARLVARRVPGRDGVVWWARLEGGARDTEQVRAQVGARLQELRASWSADLD